MTAKTIKDLDVIDDVWIKDGEELFKGWVFERSRRCIYVVYGTDQRDYCFQLPRPLTVDKIEQGDKVLYCNNPENDNKI